MQTDNSTATMQVNDLSIWCRQCKALLCPLWRIHHYTGIWFLKICNLFLAAWAIMIFMPEAVHWRTKKANSKHHRHHTTDNSCQAWFRLYGGNAGAAAVDAVERSGSVSENGLLNRNALGIADEGVRRNDTGLVGVLVRMVDRRVGDPHWFS